MNEVIRGIIYDMDDLMVNSDPLHARAWDALLKKCGHAFSELDEKTRSSFIGMRVIDTTKEIIRHLKLDVDAEDFYQERIDIFLELVKAELESMPGLHESLQRFKEQGYVLALASSGAKKYIQLVLERFAIADYFDVIVSGDDVHIGKPDPETYVVAAKKLGLVPETCLVLEDATKGIQAAKGAGCRCIAVRNRYTPPQDHSQADKVVDSLNEITIEMVKSF